MSDSTESVILSKDDGLRIHKSVKSALASLEGNDVKNDFYPFYIYWQDGRRVRLHSVKYVNHNTFIPFGVTIEVADLLPGSETNALDELRDRFRDTLGDRNVLPSNFDELPVSQLCRILESYQILNNEM